MNARDNNPKRSSLYWDAGWTAWLKFTREQKSSQKSPEASPVLLRWMTNQREQYRLFQEGKPSDLTQETINRMNAKKFPWEIPQPGHEKKRDQDDATTDTNVQSEEESKQRSQRRSKRKRSNSNVASPASPSEKQKARRSRRLSNETKTKEAEEMEVAEQTTERYPRRSRKNVTDRGMVDSSIIGSRTIQHEKNTPGSPGKSSYMYQVVKKDSRGEESVRKYECRNLKRLIPEEEEGKVRKQCRKEFKDLLVCDEATEPDKSRGVDPHMARIIRQWEECFFEFLVFKKVYGHGIVPKLFPENLTLGRWTAKVRSWKKKKDPKLTKSRLHRLNAVGFVWDAKKDPAFWSIQQQTTQEETKWETNFNMLLDFKKEHGHVLVPKEYDENRALARWVSLQRKEKKLRDQGEISHLTDERVERLHSLGFAWNTRSREHLRQAVFSRFQDRWDKCMESLKKFKAKYGHCAVPRRWKEDEDLAAWAMRQRAQGRKFKQGIDCYLTQERYDELVGMDFVFHMERGKYSLDGVGSGISQPDDDDEDDNRPDEDGPDTPEIDDGNQIESQTSHDERDARSPVTESSDKDSTEAVEAEVLPVDTNATEMKASVDHSGEDSEQDEDEKHKALLRQQEEARQEALLRQKEEHQKQESLLRSHNKGRWVCEKTGKDDHLSYVNFLAYEATSLGLSDLVMDQADILD